MEPKSKRNPTQASTQNYHSYKTLAMSVYKAKYQDNDFYHQTTYHALPSSCLISYYIFAP